MLTGILMALLAAGSQSAAYLFSRTFEKGAFHLLIISHIHMGIFSLLLIPFVIPPLFPPLSTLLPVLFGSGLFYILAQCSLLFALSKTEASRISPLLGLKILFVAGVGVLFFDLHLDSYKWCGIGATALGGWVINSSGKSPHPSAVPLVLFSCLCYSLSDLTITLLVHLFPHFSTFKASLFSVSLIYLFLGILALPCALLKKSISHKTLSQSFPYSLSWFLAMVFLFSAFATIGVVFAVIVQSTRGIISITLGYLIGLGADNQEIEQRISTSLLLHRLIGACLMTAGVAFFVMSS